MWFGRLGVCATEVLARSYGDPIHFAEGGASVIGDFLRGMLAGTGREGIVRVLRPGESPVTVCDLDGPGRAAADPGGARLLKVVPEGGADPAGVPAHPHVWSYLAWEHARPPRFNAGRWRDDEAPRRVFMAEAYSQGARWSG